MSLLASTAGFGLPELNATLNAIATALLVAGWRAIRRREIERHRRCMVAAFTTSALFLVSYLVHKFTAGDKRFPGVGAIRGLYLAILATHIVLAIAIVPLASCTLWLGLKQRLDRHKRLARVTLPIWLYVSVTGVVIWWMLYTDTFVASAGG